jgi:hypothetical protein
MLRGKLSNAVMRDGIWHCRRRVPKELVPRLRRREITMSLGARSPDEASRLCRLAYLAIERLFDESRMNPAFDPAQATRAVRQSYEHCSSRSAVRAWVAPAWSDRVPSSRTAAIPSKKSTAPIAITISVTRRTGFLGGGTLAGGRASVEGSDAVCSSAMASSLPRRPDTSCRKVIRGLMSSAWSPQ